MRNLYSSFISLSGTIGGEESGVNEEEWREKESRIQFHHDERKDEEFVCFLYDELI